MRGARRDRIRDEFDQFAAAAADPLLRTAYLIVWDLGEAEDLVQECLLKVARRWPRVRSMEHRLAYARRILINLALDGAEGRTRRRGELGQDPDIRRRGLADTRADPIDLFGMRSELTGALRHLPPRQRAVLVLRYFHDLSEGQIAETLGCSVGTVKSTASRALERLRTELAADRGALRPEPVIDSNQGAQIS